MNNQFDSIQKWLDKRSPRDRLYLFIMGFIFLYLIYFVFLSHPLANEKDVLAQKITASQAQQLTMVQQINSIKELSKNHVFVQMIGEQKRLTLQLDKMQQQIDNLKPAFISDEEIPKLTKKILSQQRDNTILISLEELPVEPWIPQTEVDKKNVLSTFSEVEQHIFQIEFHNDYFSTVEYLKRIEKISANVYWDSLDYKVLQYPKADVVIKFHVLSLQKS